MAAAALASLRTIWAGVSDTTALGLKLALEPGLYTAVMLCVPGVANDTGNVATPLALTLAVPSVVGLGRVLVSTNVTEPALTRMDAKLGGWTITVAERFSVWLTALIGTDEVNELITVLVARTW